MGLWLTTEEVAELTARIRWTAQCRILARMGITFRTNAAGRPLVERAAVVSTANRKVAEKPGPNWNAVRNRAA